MMTAVDLKSTDGLFSRCPVFWRIGRFGSGRFGSVFRRGSGVGQAGNATDESVAERRPDPPKCGTSLPTGGATF